MELTALAYAIASTEHGGGLHPQAAALLQEARLAVEAAHGLPRHRQAAALGTLRRSLEESAGEAHPLARPVCLKLLQEVEEAL